MTQKLLEGKDIHIAGLIHQGCSGVAQLMGGKAIQSGSLHCAGDQLFYPAVRDTFLAHTGDKYRFFLG